MLEVAIANAFIATLLAIFVFIFGSVCKKPALLHALWIMVLVKLLVWPIADLPIPETLRGNLQQTALSWDLTKRSADDDVGKKSGALTNGNPNSNKKPTIAPSASGIVAQAPAAKSVTEPGICESFTRYSWRTWLVVLWMVGSVGFAMSTAIQILRFRVAVRTSYEISPKLEQLAKEVANRYQMSVPRIRMVNATMSPVVWSFLAGPVVYVPEQLLGELDDRETSTLLAHEFAHIKRWDYLIRWLELVTTVLYWWLPFVWVARSRLRAAEEQLCDAMVVDHFPAKTSSYVSTLLRTVEFLIDSRGREPVLGSGMGNFRILKRRCEMIMGRTFEKLSASNRILLWTLAIATLPFAISFPSSNVAEAQQTRTSAADLVNRDQSGLEQEKSSNTNNEFFDSSTSEDRLLDRETKLMLGDVRMRLDDLLELKGFESKRQESLFGGGNDALAVVHSSDRASNESGYWQYKNKTKAFTKISYQESDEWPSYFRFEVRGKYDSTAARVQLERQLSRAFGAPQGTRRIEHNGNVMSLSFRVQRRDSSSPHVIIELHEIPDWAPESETERRKRQQDASQRKTSDDLFGQLLDH